MTVEFPGFTHALLAAKKAKSLSFGDLEKLLGSDEVWIASVFYGQNRIDLEGAQKLAEVLGLGEDIVTAITAYPHKGLGSIVPTDPLIYRFYEIMQVYGYPIAEIINEKFGDGIMSAIDFTLDIEKVEDPKGDRVKVIMNGKFLPYKKW
jgi:cyanate lyase